MDYRLRLLVSILALTLATILPAFAAETRLEIDPASTEVSFTVEATGHDVSGRLFVQSGHLAIDPETGGAEGEITIDATRGDSGNEKRDRTMVKKVFEGHLYPRIVFQPESFTGELMDDGTSEIEIHGKVTIDGGEHPLTLPTRLERNGGTWTATTTFPVPYVEWGMKNPSLLFLRVGKTVEITIAAAGQVAAEQVAQTPAAGSH